MGDMPHKTAVYAALTKQHHPESSPYLAFTSQRAMESTS
jgi:hypothetical protein